MARAAGLTAGAEVMAKTMRPQDIAVNPELDIFEIDGALIEDITQSIREKGYDISQPLVLWKGQGCVVDGRSRLKAALAAELPEIPVVEREFENLEAAVKYAFRRQAERRNLTQGEILEASIRLGIKDYRDGKGRSGEWLARSLGVSESTIKRSRAVAKHGSEEDHKAIKKGEKTINQVYQGLRQKNKKDEAGRYWEKPIDRGPPADENEWEDLADNLEAAGGCREEMEDIIAVDDAIAVENNNYEIKDPLETDNINNEGMLVISASSYTSNEDSGTTPIEADFNTESADMNEKEISEDIKDNEMPSDYPESRSILQIKFLNEAVVLLCEKGQIDGAKILIHHFVHGDALDSFFKNLPGSILVSVQQ
jgi:ParB-like chromosome segregation protein Spo0J